MNKHILFIQGGGDDGYNTDKRLVARLQTALPQDYTIHYPELKSDEAAPDFGWPAQIGREISQIEADVILVGHSLGASMILKYLSQNNAVSLKGIFLLATPFWAGEEDWKAGLKLPENFAEQLPQSVPIFLYHCEDDEEVPFAQMQQYRQKMKRAIFREIKEGGHQFNHDLTTVAHDIMAL